MIGMMQQNLKIGIKSSKLPQKNKGFKPPATIDVILIGWKNSRGFRDFDTWEDAMPVKRPKDGFQNEGEFIVWNNNKD